MDMLTIHKPSCVKPSPEPSPIFDYQQPPSFIPSNSNHCIANNYLYSNTGDKERAAQSLRIEDGLLPDLHHNVFDLTETFVKNPSVMLSVADGKCKDALHIRQNTSDCSSFKTMPNFNFLDDSGNNNHFDVTSYVDNSSSRCIV